MTKAYSQLPGEYFSGFQFSNSYIQGYFTTGMPLGITDGKLQVRIFFYMATCQLWAFEILLTYY